MGWFGNKDQKAADAAIRSLDAKRKVLDAAVSAARAEVAAAAELAHLAEQRRQIREGRPAVQPISMALISAPLPTRIIHALPPEEIEREARERIAFPLVDPDIALRSVEDVHRELSTIG